MTDARARDATDSPVARPIENSYVVPGTRLIAGEYPGSPSSNPTSDLEGKLARFLDAGITVFVDLTRPDDLLDPYEPTLRVVATRRGTEVHYEHLPIRDQDVCDEQYMCRVLDTIGDHLAARRTVYLHCWGGVGRTGTVVGCLLVRRGNTGQEALNEVTRLFNTMSPAKLRRHALHGSPETPAQRAMVKDWPEGMLTKRTSARTAAARRRRAERTAPDAAHVQAVVDAPTPNVVPTVADRPVADLRREQSGIARSLHTRIRGCMLGGALGDALGWPVEFRSLAEIRSAYGVDGIQELEVRGRVAEITDDTQMTLFTAEGLLRSTTRHIEYWAYSEPEATAWAGSHAPNPDVMWLAYHRWLQTQQPGGTRADTTQDPAPRSYNRGWLIGERGLHWRRAPGNTCLQSLMGATQGSVETPVNNSKGCGGVMRVAPIGLVPCDDPFAYAVMAAALTHGHPSGYLAAGAYAQIIADLLYLRLPRDDHYSPAPSLRDAVVSALARLQRERGHGETSAALTCALELAARAGEPSPERVEELGRGFVADEALAIGVYCAIVADDFAHGVRLAVNHGGDSDSTGSIAGALLGVQCGEYGLPPGWTSRLELRDVISAVADDLMIGYGGGETWRERYPGN